MNETNDIRNTPAVDLVRHLIDDGAAEIKVYDPVAAPAFIKMFDASKDDRYAIINNCQSEEEALKGTQACMILTYWPKFRAIGDVIASNCPLPYLIMDGRRMLAGQLDKMRDLGYDVIAVGSPFYKGKNL